MTSSSAFAPPRGSGLASIPGDAGPPLVGHTFRYMRDPVGWGRQRYADYGPVSWSKVFTIRLVTLIGADATEVMLRNRDGVFSQAGWEYFIGPFFRRGLMLLDFDEHLSHRRVMQQAFTRARLEGYLASYQPVIDAGLDAWQPGEGFLVYPALKRLTLDVAARVFMGADPGDETRRLERDFIDTVRAGTAFVRAPVPGGRWWRGLRGRRRLARFFRERIPAQRASSGRHEAATASRPERQDLFAALCHAETDDGEAFDDQAVVDHMIFLMMAAHDTTTITLSTMFFELAKHPEWQERCRAESEALGTDTLGYEELGQLESLDLVMRECLRKVAPVPALPRKTVADTEVCGYYLPAGTMVAVAPLVLGNLAELWPEPERFDPERFAAHRREDQVHPYAWVPFGGGVHKCIGMAFGQLEVKTAMHKALRRFHWSVDAGYEMPLDTTALPVPADGLPVRLHARG